MTKPLIIFGSAELASLAHFYFSHDSDYKVEAFTVDDNYVKEGVFESLPVVPFSDVMQKYSPEKYDMHVALSYMKLNKTREAKYFQAKEAGYTLANYISSKLTSWPDLVMGDNCMILEDQTLQPTIRIGNNVVMWSGNHIGHGTIINDHTYIASQCVLSGHCTIGQRCFIGVNATVKDFTTIGDDVFIGMGASVTKDMSNGAVAISKGADIFEHDDRKAMALKRAYFKL